MSKLGLGIYVNAPELVDDVLACHSDSVLLVEDALHLAGSIRARLPGIEIHGRKWLSADDQVGRINSASRQQITRDWINQAMDQYPDVDNWQLYNEVVESGNTLLLERQVDAEIAGAAACADRGKGAIVINQAPGNNPTLEPGDTQRWWWDEWLAAMELILTARGVRYLGIHCYSSEKARLAEPSCLWYSLRYRYLLRDLAAQGVQCPPLCITEYGHAGGWRDWLSEDDCKRDLTWYGAQLEMDAGERLRSAHLFADGDSGGWGNYDVRGTSIPRAMGDWNRSIGGIPVTLHMWTLGFATYATAHPGVGMPIEGLQYDDQGNAWQHSDKGLLFWHKAANKTYFFPKS